MCWKHLLSPNHGLCHTPLNGLKAPTDVLEALNRLLDDNRELFISETQTVVTPHPEFMLFATQNPPGSYGGRKPLSRAFRNRFVELHFDDLPSDELKTILELRCTVLVFFFCFI
jgi:midasin